MIVISGSLKFEKSFDIKTHLCSYEGHKNVVFHEFGKDFVQSLCKVAGSKIVPGKLSLNTRADKSVPMIHINPSVYAQFLKGKWLEIPGDYWMLANKPVSCMGTLEVIPPIEVTGQSIPVTRGIYKLDKTALVRVGTGTYVNVFGVYDTPPIPSDLAVVGYKYLTEYYQGCGISKSSWEILILLAKILFGKPKMTTEELAHRSEATILAKRETSGAGSLLADILDPLGFSLGGSITNSSYTREALKKFLVTLPIELVWKLISGVRVTEFLIDSQDSNSSRAISRKENTVEALLFTENLGLWVEVIAQYILYNKAIDNEVLVQVDNGYELRVDQDCREITPGVNSLHIGRRAYATYLKPLSNRR